MLTVDSISYQRDERSIFHNINFKLSAGECLLLKGANGIGKTSLLKCLLGLLPIQSGRVCFDGIPIEKNLQHYHAQCLYFGHKLAMKPQLTVQQYCYFSFGYRLNLSDENIIEALRMLGLANKLMTPTVRLSAGEKTRLALTQLILSRARLWYLDEPLNHLDDIGRQWLQSEITRFISSGGAVAMSTHQHITLQHAKISEVNLDKC